MARPVSSAAAVSIPHSRTPPTPVSLPPTPAGTPTPALPPQGIFTSCDIAADLAACEQRLPLIAGAGLQLVVQGLPALSPALASYLHALKAQGLQAIWELTNPGWWGYNGAAPFGYDPAGHDMPAADPSWASACGCDTNAALLAFIVHALTTSGVTYGWYLADDSQLIGAQAYPLATALAGIKRLSDDIHATAPGTRTLLGAWGLDDTSLLRQASGNVDLPAQEMYPFASYGGVAVSDRDATAQTARAATATRQIAETHGGEPAFILQAFSWGECAADASASGADPGSAYPSAPQMTEMRNAVLTSARPALILWYTLEETIGWTAGQQPSDCAAPADPAVRLAALTAAVKAPYPAAPGR